MIVNKINSTLFYPIACHDIDQWPDPCPGETLNLPIMGTVVQVNTLLLLLLLLLCIYLMGVVCIIYITEL